MADNDSVDEFTHWFSKLRSGVLLDFLRRGQFPAWIELASRDLITRECGLIAEGLPHTIEQAHRVLQRPQVAALARRLILSRDAALLESLRPLWRMFGTSDELCQKAVGATVSANKKWQAQLPCESDAGYVAFSPAHAEFVESITGIASGISACWAMRFGTPEASTKRATLAFRWLSAKTWGRTSRQVSGSNQNGQAEPE